MRLREKTYEDWGLTKELVTELRKKCREIRHQPTLFAAAYEANPELAPFIYFSLSAGLSYDDISRAFYIPMCMESFYAYRRYALTIFQKSLNGYKENQ